MIESPEAGMRADAAAIYRAALAAAEPAEAVLRALRLDGDVLRVGAEEIDLNEVSAIWIVGAGKAARGMASGVVDLLGARVAGGSIAVPERSHGSLEPLDVWEAGHPVPDVHSLAAAAAALRIARRARREDLVLCLISGGASALWTAPPAEVTLGDVQRLVAQLLAVGAPIQEINTVRRQLSRIAGGRLARAAAPARIVTLAISDVIGATPHDIGSGPTVPDPTGYQDALSVIATRGVDAPPAVRHHLHAGAAGELDDAPFDAQQAPPFHLIGSIREALAAAAEEAVRLGYTATVVSDRLEGSAGGAGGEIARAALAADAAGGGPQALLWGGETTVEVRGAGRGGRNQELALSAAISLGGAPDVVLAALATDGVDGPTPAAGAIIDSSTLERGRTAGLDPDSALADNDSYTFLRAAGDLVVTGPSGTNVNDLVVALIG